MKVLLARLDDATVKSSSDIAKLAKGTLPNGDAKMEVLKTAEEIFGKVAGRQYKLARAPWE